MRFVQPNGAGPALLPWGLLTAREHELCRAGACLQALSMAVWAAPCRGSAGWCILQSNPSWEQTGAVTKQSSELFTQGSSSLLPWQCHSAVPEGQT